MLNQKKNMKGEVMKKDNNILKLYIRRIKSEVNELWLRGIRKIDS